MFKDGSLDFPMASKRGCPVETDLADVAGLWKKNIEQWKLALSFVRELWMQAKTCPDARRSHR
jgi:hypothetical protein